MNIIGIDLNAVQLSRIQSAAPVLQIPSDQSRWQLMQKGLVANGVYHVLMPNGHRQYCLWNGKQLVPCELLFMLCQK
jgi:hypothetical protein